MDALKAVVLFLRAMFVRKAHLAVENLALRQQLAVLTPTPRTRNRHRVAPATSSRACRPSPGGRSGRPSKCAGLAQLAAKAAVLQGGGRGTSAYRPEASAQRLRSWQRRQPCCTMAAEAPRAFARLTGSKLGLFWPRMSNHTFMP